MRHPYVSTDTQSGEFEIWKSGDNYSRCIVFRDRNKTKRDRVYKELVLQWMRDNPHVPTEYIRKKEHKSALIRKSHV